MKRIVYLAIFTVLALVAATLTLRAQHTIAVLTATRDLAAGAQVASGDVQLRSVRADSVTDGVLTNPADATGHYVTWPLTAGQPVMARAVSLRPYSRALLSGLSVPNGYRAVAVPVAPANAVGGMLSTGDRVDVFATPQQGRQAPAPLAGGEGGAAPGSATVRLGHEVTVLQLRSDLGAAMDAQRDDSSSVHGLNFGAGKLGSVVLAVPADQADRYAAAVSGDTIYLALSVS